MRLAVPKPIGSSGGGASVTSMSRWATVRNVPSPPMTIAARAGGLQLVVGDAIRPLHERSDAKTVGGEPMLKTQRAILRPLPRPEIGFAKISMSCMRDIVSAEGSGFGVHSDGRPSFVSLNTEPAAHDR